MYALAFLIPPLWIWIGPIVTDCDGEVKAFTNQEKEIEDAKRDQQLLTKLVEKIDIASQDYAENAELATNTVTTLALGTGGLVGWVSNKIMKACKSLYKNTKENVF